MPYHRWSLWRKLLGCPKAMRGRIALLKHFVRNRWQGYGRGGGVGRLLGVGPPLGVGVGLGVEVGVGVAVAVAVGVAVAVAVAVTVAVAVAVAVAVGLTVGVGVGVPCSGTWGSVKASPLPLMRESNHMPRTRPLRAPRP